MESETHRKTRSRAEILGAIAAIPHAVQGKVCEMRKRLAGGGTPTYYNLQYWSEGRNHSIHVPRKKLAEFMEGRAWAVVEESGRMADGGKNAAEMDRKLQYYRDNYDRMRYDEYSSTEGSSDPASSRAGASASSNSALACRGCTGRPRARRRFCRCAPSTSRTASRSSSPSSSET